MPARSLRRRFKALEGESGFTLIEAVAALGVVMVMMLALTSTVIAGYRSTREARFFQQATALGNQVIETARDLGYDDLVMITSDLTSDPAVLSGFRFDPDGPGPLVSEPLVHTASGGSFTPHIRTETVDGKDFTVRAYATWVDEGTQGGPAQHYKRITAIVDWETGGRAATYNASAFVTRARRGLPLPAFEAAPSHQSVTTEPGFTVDFVHTVRNLGIVDTYDITVTPPAGKVWNVGVFQDVDLDGEFDDTVDTALVDTNGNGKVDTGSVNTNETFQFLVTADIPAGESTGTFEITVNVASGAVPEVSQTLVDSVTVVGAGGVSDTGVLLYLYNKPHPPTADVNAATGMDMNNTSPTTTTLYRYSQNLYTARPGRYVDKGATSASETNSSRMVNWYYQMPQNTSFNGTWEAQIWAAVKDFDCDKPLSFTAYLRHLNNGKNNPQLIGTATGGIAANPGGGECGFVPVTLNFGTFSRNISRNNWVELKIITNASSGDAGLYAYDTTTHPARLKLPQVSQ